MASRRKQEQRQAAVAPPGTKRVVGKALTLLGMSETSLSGILRDPGLIQSLFEEYRPLF